jgi:uncharacterized Zn finger protein
MDSAQLACDKCGAIVELKIINRPLLIYKCNKCGKIKRVTE